MAKIHAGGGKKRSRVMSRRRLSLVNLGKVMVEESTKGGKVPSQEERACPAISLIKGKKE